MAIEVQLARCTDPKTQPYRNMFFMNPGDMEALALENLHPVVVDDHMVYKACADPEMPPRQMGSSKLQWASLDIKEAVATRTHVTVRKWGTSEGDLDVPIAHVNVRLDTFAKSKVQINAEDITQYMLRAFANEILCPQQRFVFKLPISGRDVWFSLRIASVHVRKDGSTGVGLKNLRSVKYGRMVEDTNVEVSQNQNRFLELKFPGGKRINLVGTFNAEAMGVGGLDDQFGIIFRRAFASRLYPKEVVAELGIKHVKGMLLHGPPGTGKTLIARCIGKMLTDNEPKIVNGPEILSKFVGQAEENIRNLFEDARIDMEENGDDADLHIVIFDEIDAICKQRGSVQSGTGVHDTVVNQLLSMIDGVKALNNVLVIGMTNRKDLLDEAMLRPGRLEVHVEIALPDQIGREQIFRIHTRAIRESGHWDEKVSIEDLAERTKNYSGAEIEGVVRSAVSYAFNELLDSDQIRTLDPQLFRNVKITNEIFDLALSEVQPEYGAQDDDLALRYLGGIYRFSPAVTEIIDRVNNIARQLRVSRKMNRAAVLLRGALGTGKSALACYLAREIDYPLVRLVSPENFVGWSESAVCQHIAKVFNDAYKSPASIVIIDDFERIISFIGSGDGARFSNLILQALLTCLRRQPEIIERKVLIVVTSPVEPLQVLRIEHFFDYAWDMPMVSSPEEFRTLLEEAEIIGNIVPTDVDRIVESFSGQIGVKDIMTVLELAQDESGNITFETFREAWLAKFNKAGDESKLLMF